ncbi:hypothetical protein C5167_036545 [Papaver somniferum]|uniref:KxDL domain-containing protein n=1 Tax=Papaver somniferum TaxID=3469 RepID=A0A4Y7I847_PAPSO|nr:hypothetical protein C5167_036545 [Papaver somniferum]
MKPTVSKQRAAKFSILPLLFLYTSPAFLLILLYNRKDSAFRLGRLQDRNAILSHFNEPSERCFAQVAPDFNRNTRLLNSMKTDLDYVFLKLRERVAVSTGTSGNIDGYSLINPDPNPFEPVVCGYIKSFLNHNSIDVRVKGVYHTGKVGANVNG